MAESITICDQVFLDDGDERNELVRDDVAKFMRPPSSKRQQRVMCSRTYCFRSGRAV